MTQRLVPTSYIIALFRKSRNRRCCCVRHSSSSSGSQSRGAESGSDDGDRQTDFLTASLIGGNTSFADEASSTMEGNIFPDQEQLLQFLRRLKEVFDVCDEDADGFIRVEHLVDLGLQFGQGEEVSTDWATIDT